MQSIKFGIISLGCSKNRVDTEVMLGILKRSGAVFTSDPSVADAILINTCGFINDAKQESINTILEMAEYKKKGKLKCLIVTGCLVQKYGRELADELPEVDVFLGVFNFQDIIEAIKSTVEGKQYFDVSKTNKEIYYNNRFLTTPKYQAYVKIGDGCSNNCSYCTIPQIRGKYVSRKSESIIEEVKTLASNGVKELILISQDTSKYGTDIGTSLKELLAKIRNIQGFEWIRILYTYPNGIDEGLLDAIAQDTRICKYIDMPIQHINDGILGAMNRKSTKKQIYDCVELIRKYGDFALRTTLITGFPGETDEQHKELLDALRELKFDNVGIFEYSQEEGTKAAEMKQVPQEVKKMRHEEILRVQANISAALNEKRVGKKYRVLIENHDNTIDRFYGRAQFQAPEVDGKIFLRASDKQIKAGDFVSATIKKSYDYDLLGVL